MLQSSLELVRALRDGVWRVQVVQHILASGGVTHDHDFSGGLAFLDEFHALRDLFDVLVETADTPAAVRGGEEEVEEGPVGWFEGLC